MFSSDILSASTSFETCQDAYDSMTAATRGEPFRLGMPHMDAAGASRSWLLREACHLHWSHIAGEIGVGPTGFRDRSGARVLPSVIACTVNGDAARFQEDDEVRFRVVEVPSARNGWRSQIDLIGHHGAIVTAEILTSFARRRGSSNARLEAADLEPLFAPDFAVREASRAALLRRLGKADRARVMFDPSEPHVVIPVIKGRHLNGVGLVYFTEMHDMIAAAEHKAVPEPIQSWPIRNRRVHFFGNLDAGDTLELTSYSGALTLSPNSNVIVRSHARRASDNMVVAVAESILGT
ncbi:MAG: LnmK family bifunctional acyltransferase/decarboxylase [Pseudomonadota bacterium]